MSKNAFKIKEKKRKLFFIADTHFSSEATIIRENRPFKNAKAHDRFAIKNWNKQAGKDDLIYHIGDFLNYNDTDTNSWKIAMTYGKKIKANVVLIIGNNEGRLIDKEFGGSFQKFKKFAIENGFYDVKKDVNLLYCGLKFYLNHFPIRHKNDVINLFGHTHRITGLWKPYGINVSSDLNHFRLFTTKEILRLLQQKNGWWDADVNTNSF